jgi:hypothetical protein
MAAWQYKIHRVELLHGADLDGKIEGALEEYGAKGWELVQIMHRQQVPEDPTYRMIFKAEKTLD